MLKKWSKRQKETVIWSELTRVHELTQFLERILPSKLCRTLESKTESNCTELDWTRKIGILKTRALITVTREAHSNKYTKKVSLNFV